VQQSPFVNSAKNLGALIEPTLSGDLWVSHVCGKALGVISRLYRCGGNCLPLQAHRALINDLVLPILDYGGIIYTGLTVSNKRKLQRIQNSGMRFIHGAQRKEALTRTLYAESRCLRMEDRTRWSLLSLFLQGDGEAGEDRII